MVYSSPTSANGEIAGKYFCSYHSRPLIFSPSTLDSTPASSGTPKKTSTEVMMAQNENSAATDCRPSHDGRTCRYNQPNTPNMITWNTELMATNTAVASRSPQDKSLQIRTIAIQRAKPTIISLVRNSGSSGKKVHARINMNAGPTTQFRIKDTTINRRSEVISLALSRSEERRVGKECRW